MKHLKHVLHRNWNLLRYRGLGYFAYMFSGYLIPRLAFDLFGHVRPQHWRRIVQFSLLLSGALLFLLVSSLQGRLYAAVLLAVTTGLALLARHFIWWLTLARMQNQARELFQQTHSLPFTSWEQWPVVPEVRRAVEKYRQSQPTDEVVLGHIDNDGRVLGLFGDLPGLANITEEQFAPRHRFPLDLVLVDGKVLIRKDFRGDRRRFVREWYNLQFFMGHANVPAVYRVDEKRYVLYKNMVLGKTLRDVLVSAGAKILNVQTDDDPELVGMDRETRLYAILARGTALLRACFPESFFLKLEEQMDAFHRSGIVGLSVTFGNIMVDARGEPWFIDLEGTRHYRSTTNPIFLWRRDQDREKFNRIYGRDVFTERKARVELARLSATDPGWYAPIDFGGGLTVNGFWSVDSGTGRWDFLNHHVLASLIAGKRVLDLGSNNGLMPLMMLRDGANEVVGVELMPEMVERAHLVHRIFEWRDMCKYPFVIHTCDMRAILEADWGKFDVITAFCSLYYLNEDDMARVVRRSAELAPVTVLQAKVDTRPEAADNKGNKSSLPLLRRLLEENGFPHIDIHAPPGYCRPLLVGRRNTS